MKLERIARQLVLVGQGHGPDYLTQDELFKTYRFKKGYEIGHLWGLANQAMQQGYHKFEREQAFIQNRLPIILEPKSFWARHFSGWKSS